MFHSDIFARKGELYNKAVEKLPEAAKSAQTLAAAALRILRFRHYWNDTLAEDQNRSFKNVATGAGWDDLISSAFAADVSLVPVLGFHFTFGSKAELERINIATFRGNVASFHIPSLRRYFRQGPLPLPGQVLSWFSAPDVLLIGSGQSHSIRREIFPSVVHQYVDTEKIFSYLLTTGLIPCKREPAPKDLAAQLTFAVGYHHRPTTADDLREFVGGCAFKDGLPSTRHPRYRVPDEAHLKASSKFVLYYETSGPLLFVLRLVEHGLLYDTVLGVRREGTLAAIIRGFVLSPQYGRPCSSDGGLDQAREDALFPQGPVKQVVQEPERENPPKDSTLSIVPVQVPVVGGGSSDPPPAAASAPPASPTPSIQEIPRTPIPLVDLGTPQSSTSGLQQDAPEAMDESGAEKDPAPATAPAAGDQALEHPGAAAVTVPDAEENREEEAEVPLEIEDEELVKDVDKLGEEASPKHPGYYTSNYSRTVKILKTGAVTIRTADAQQVHLGGREDSSGSPNKKRKTEDNSSAAPRTSTGRGESPGRTRRDRDRSGGRHRPRSPPGRSPTQARAHSAPGARTGAGRRSRTPEKAPQKTQAGFKYPPPPRQPPRGFTVGDHTTAALHALAGTRPPTAAPGEHCHADLRSRLLLNVEHSAAQLSREATAAANARPGPATLRSGLAPPTPPKLDKNMGLLRRVDGSGDRKGFVHLHRHLQLAPSDMAIRCRPGEALDRTRLDQPHLNAEQRFLNKFASQPVVESKCDFCGGRHCSRHIRGGLSPNCSYYRDHVRTAPSRRLCNYRRCRDNAAHHTQVCPFALRRCPLCHCRGHGPEDRCDERDEKVMEALRADFEEVADELHYARNRATSLCWGWYPYPQGAPLTFVPVSYHTLTEMPVLQAMALLRSLLALPENQGHLSAQATLDKGPDEDSSPPPPPPPAAAAMVTP